MAEIYRNGTLLRSITKLDYFGERAILFNKNRSATVIAQTEVQVWELTSEHFTNCINDAVKY